MTTMAAVHLSDAVRTLIDARLDTIDRMLLGRVPRSDRLAIVREVEGQIHDLLGERGSDEPDRDDVLAVLARLDPPEAYLPEDEAGGTAVVRMPSRPVSAAPNTVSGVARASGILGLSAVGLIFLAPAIFVVAELLGSEILFYIGVGGAAALSFTTSLIAIALAVYARLRGAWAVVGLVTGITSALLSLVGGVGLVFLL